MPEAQLDARLTCAGVDQPTRGWLHALGRGKKRVKQVERDSLWKAERGEQGRAETGREKKNTKWTESERREFEEE